MRILHIDTGDRIQGGQWQLLYLMRGLRERGFAQALVSDGDIATLARAEDFDVCPQGSFVAADVVHAHSAGAHKLAALRGVGPLVVSRRVGFPLRGGMLSKWKYSRADRYIAISNYVAGVLLDSGIRDERVSVVYDGVPEPVTVEAEKNTVFYGVLKDPLAGLLQEAAKKAGVEVRDIGKIQEDMKSARALAYVTAMQGLGSAAIYAMASGVPVIASAVGGLPEVVEHERTGLLVGDNVDEIAGALTRLKDDNALVARFGREARAEALSRFTAQGMVEGTVHVYERLLG